jgi:hypothetical protein
MRPSRRNETGRADGSVAEDIGRRWLRRKPRQQQNQLFGGKIGNPGNPGQLGYYHDSLGAKPGKPGRSRRQIMV